MGRWIDLLRDLLAAVGAFFKKAKPEPEEIEQSEMDRIRAATNSTADVHKRVNDEVEQVQKKHREEQRDEEKRLKAGRRDHFDSDW